MKNKFECRDDIKEIQQLSPWLMVILADVIMWAHPRQLDVVVTSMMREQDNISQSQTHQTGRALDLSVKGWNKAQIEELGKYINEKYKAVGAVSASTMQPLTCFYHNNGNGWHFHIQVKPIIQTFGVQICLK